MKLKKNKIQEIKSKYKLDYIAKEIGVSKQFISYLFNDKRGCSRKTAQKIINIVDSKAKLEEYFEEK